MTRRIGRVAVGAAVLVMSGCATSPTGPVNSSSVVSSSTSVVRPASSPASPSTAQTYPADAPAPDAATTAVALPYQDWGNSRLRVFCNRDLVSFHNGEATWTDYQGNEQYAQLGQVTGGMIGGEDYAIVPTYCSAGSDGNGLASVYKVTDAGGYVFVRALEAPKTGDPYTFSQIRVDAPDILVVWDGYSSVDQPVSSPDIAVTVAYDLLGVDGGDHVTSVRRTRPAAYTWLGAQPDQVRVPNFVGLSPAQAKMLALRSPVHVWLVAPAGVSVTETISNMSDCMVTSQSPAAGSVVRRGAMVQLRQC